MSGPVRFLRDKQIDRRWHRIGDEVSFHPVVNQWLVDRAFAEFVNGPAVAPPVPRVPLPTTEIARPVAQAIATAARWGCCGKRTA